MLDEGGWVIYPDDGSQRVDDIGPLALGHLEPRHVVGDVGQQLGEETDLGQFVECDRFECEDPLLADVHRTRSVRE